MFIREARLRPEVILEQQGKAAGSAMGAGQEAVVRKSRRVEVIPKGQKPTGRPISEITCFNCGSCVP